MAMMCTFSFQWDPKCLAHSVNIYYQYKDSTSVLKPEAYVFLLLFEIRKISFHYTSTFKVLHHSLQVLKS